MARSSELVKESVKELSAKLKEIKETEEDDLGTLGDLFDDLSATADKVAQRLYSADKALSQDGEDEDQGPTRGEQAEGQVVEGQDEDPENAK